MPTSLSEKAIANRPASCGPAVLTTLAGYLCALILAAISIAPSARAASPTTDECRGAELEHALSHLYQDVCPAVVGVESYRLTRVPTGISEESPVSVRFRHMAASGIVVGNRGCVVTTARVAQPGDSILIHFRDGRTVSAKYLGVDPDLNIVVLRLTGVADFPSLQLAVVDSLPEWVAAVAYGPWTGDRPGEPSLTLAQRPAIRVTATRFGGRPAELWQIQAPFVPGNAGGALVTVDGEWLGLITGALAGETSKETSTSSSATGVIVPADIVALSVDEIESGQSPSEGFLGLRAARAAQPRNAGQIGIDVEEVLPGSPADCAGIRTGDVITSVDRAPLSTANELIAMIRARRPGDTIALAVTRAGVTGVALVTLGDRRASDLYFARRKAATSDTSALELELRALRERAQAIERRLGALKSASGDTTPGARPGDY